MGRKKRQIPSWLVKNSFDVVIGNPPWCSFSGREAQNINEEKFSFYSANYQTFKGWLSTVPLFFEAGAGLLKSGGIMGMVGPSSMEYLDGYQPLKEYLDRNGLILRESIQCGDESFKAVSTPASIFIYEKGAGELNGEREKADFTGIGNVLPFMKSNLLPKEDKKFLQRIENECPKPESETFKDIGVHSGNSAGLILSRTTPKGQKCAPIYEGQNITPFKLSPASKWLLLDVSVPEGKYFTIRPIERYLSGEVLIRQTAHYPIAAVHAPKTYFRNSVLACFSIPEQCHSKTVMAAILNSWLIRYYFQISFPDLRQKAFPQIKIKHLQKMPLPIHAVSPHFAKLLKDAVKEYLLSSEEMKHRAFLHINFMVSILYDITFSEAKLIEGKVEEARTANFAEEYIKRLAELKSLLNS